MDSPFIVKLRFSFQDTSNLYFVTDYYSGGDFFSLIEQQPYNRLCESYARAYVQEPSFRSLVAGRSCRGVRKPALSTSRLSRSEDGEHPHDE